MTLRARIQLLTTGVTALVLVLFSVPLVLLLRSAADETARNDAVDVAQGVADYISTGAATDEVLVDYVDRVNERDDAIPVSVRYTDGTVIGSEIPEVDLSADPDVDGDGVGDRDGDGDEAGGPTYGDLRPTTDAELIDVENGRVVRIVVLADEGAVNVYAYVSDAHVRAYITHRLVLLVLAALALLVAAAAAADLVARRLVRHLAAAAATADRLGEGDLGARVPDEGAEEVRRLGSALNRLAGRIEELLVAERETVADLSHRLRTPLMAVRLDVESLPESDARNELDAHVANLERSLTAVIHAARRPEREGVSPQCDALGVARAQFEFWAPLAEDQGREVRIEQPPDGTVLPAVRCAESDLRAAIDALLENAVAHTADGVPIRVTIGAGPEAGHDAVVVDVSDRGPGLPPGAVRRGASDRGSTGLGLDIARACAEASGGRLEILSVDGWSTVRLVLGPARAARGHLTPI